MKLYPHVVTDTINRLIDEDIWSDREQVLAFKELLEDAVLFDFGTLRPSVEHVDFACDLYNRGLFKLPYGCTAFYSVCHGKESLMVMTHHPDKPLLASILIVPLHGEDERTSGALPLIMLRDDEPNMLKAKPPPGTRPVRVHMYLKHEVNEAICGKDYFDEMAQGSDALAVECMGYVAMLMSKGVETTLTPAPVKLNKARAKKKKPPIGDRYTVTINLNKYVRHPDSEGDYSRASPRPHWRRGHFRTLERADGEKRVIPIAPMLVAVRDDGPVPTPVYKAKA